MPLNLIVQTAFLGDLLLSIPLLKKTREIWPSHKLVLVCRKGVGGFFLKTGLVDQVFEVQKGDSSSYTNILQQLKSEGVDHLISPHQSLRTAFFCAQIRATKKISFKNFWSGLFFSQCQEKVMMLPDALRQLSLLSSQDKDLRNKLAEFAENEKPYVKDEKGRLTAPPTWASMSVKDKILGDGIGFDSLSERIALGFLGKEKVVLIFPGSVWATKRWTKDGFVKTGQTLQKAGYKVIVMGGPGEEALAEEVAQSIPGAFSLAGKTSIYESALIIARSNLVIANDSASAHLATACETPLVSIFGPTVLEFGFRPWSRDSYVVEENGLYCRPCGKHGHKKCPLGHHRCMNDIPPERVSKTAVHILEGRH